MNSYWYHHKHDNICLFHITYGVWPDSILGPFYFLSTWIITRISKILAHLWRTIKASSVRTGRQQWDENFSDFVELILDEQIYGQLALRVHFSSLKCEKSHSQFGSLALKLICSSWSLSNVIIIMIYIMLPIFR